MTDAPTAHDAAQEILERYGDRRLPVNPLRIVRAMDAPKRLWSIPLYADGTLGNKRYAVAYELGRYLAGRHGIHDARESDRWARNFALELLIPTNTLLVLWARGRGAFRLTAIFSVDLIHMRQRLQMLGFK